VSSVDPNQLSGPFGWLRLAYHFPNFCKLIWRLFLDRRVSVLPKALVVLAVVYFFVPLDLWFDWYPPGIGHIDDLLILGIAAKTFIRWVPREVLQEHVKRIDEEDPRRR